MAEDHEICPGIEIEDGGVLLPNLDPEVDTDDEASSPGPPTSETFPASSHSAHPWLNGSDSTSPPITGVSDQHASLEPGPSFSMLPNTSEGAGAALSSEASSGLQAQIPVIEESEPLQYGGPLDTNTSQDNTLMDSQIINGLHAPDSVSTEFQGNGGAAQGVITPAQTSLLDGHDSSDSPSTTDCLSSDEETPLSGVFRDYLPGGSKC